VPFAIAAVRFGDAAAWFSIVEASYGDRCTSRDALRAAGTLECRVSVADSVYLLRSISRSAARASAASTQRQRAILRSKVPR